VHGLTPHPPRGGSALEETRGLPSRTVNWGSLGTPCASAGDMGWSATRTGLTWRVAKRCSRSATVSGSTDTHTCAIFPV